MDEHQALVPTMAANREFYTNLPFWQELDSSAKTLLQKETKGLLKAHAGQVSSRTEFVEHLANIQRILKKEGQFGQYTEALDMNYRRVYRYLAAFREVQKQVSLPVLRLAAERGVDLVGYTAKRPFGTFTEAVKALPPPKSPEPEKVAAWIEGLEAKRQELPSRKARRKRSLDVDVALKEAFRGAVGPFQHVEGGRVRTNAQKRLLALLMTEFGIPRQVIEPEGVPDGFRAVIGRPRTKTA